MGDVPAPNPTQLVKGFLFGKRKGSTRSGLTKFDYAVKTTENTIITMSSFHDFEVLK